LKKQKIEILFLHFSGTPHTEMQQSKPDKAHSQSAQASPALLAS
jgi:hypothetical protein